MKKELHVHIGARRRGSTGRGPLVLLERDPAHVSVSYANRIYHHDRKNREGIEKILSLTSLSDSWRRSFIGLKAKA